MILEIELGLIALADVVMVAAAVAVLLRLRRMVEEVEQLSRQVNDRLPLLLKLTRETIQTANAAASDVRQGVAGVRQLGDAFGQIAMGINQAQLAIRHGTDAAARNAIHTIQGWIDGFQAAWHVVKNRETASSRLHRLPSASVLSDMSKSGSSLPPRLTGSRGDRRL